MLHAPPSGGRPVTLSAPMAKAAKVNGIRRPSPAMSLISVLCAATMIAPAQKNSVILPKACIAMCIAPPTTLHVVARAAPRTT